MPTGPEQEEEGMNRESPESRGYSIAIVLLSHRASIESAYRQDWLAYRGGTVTWDIGLERFTRHSILVKKGIND